MTNRLEASRALVVIALGALLTGCGLHGKPKVQRQEDAGGNAPTAVTAGETSMRAVVAAPAAGREVVAPGIVEPWDAQVELSAQESGWIATIRVREGEVVRAGQLLATLDDEPQRRGVELARAEWAEAEATLTKTERGATREELRQAQADYDAAVARGTFARAAAARAAQLRRNATIPENEVDRATSDAAAQTALAARAEARLREVERGPRVEDRDAARARSAAARARLQLAEANLARRQVLAPRSGTVLLSRFHPGEFYTAGAGPLLVLGDMTRLQVRLEIDEIDAHDVRVGARCALYSDGGAPLGEGIVARLAPKMGRRALPLESPTARTDVRIREVFVEVPATSSLVPGQRVWGRASRTTVRNES